MRYRSWKKRLIFFHYTFSPNTKHSECKQIPRHWRRYSSTSNQPTSEEMRNNRQHKRRKYWENATDWSNRWVYSTNSLVFKCRYNSTSEWQRKTAYTICDQIKKSTTFGASFTSYSIYMRAYQGDRRKECRFKVNAWEASFRNLLPGLPSKVTPICDKLLERIKGALYESEEGSI